MKNKLIITIGILVLILLGTVAYLSGIPKKMLDAEIVKLSDRLGGEVKYSAVEFDSTFFPEIVTLDNFVVNKDSIYGNLEISSPSAEIKLNDRKVEEIAFFGLNIKISALNPNFEGEEISTITTDEEVMIDISGNKGELIVVKFPQKFVSDTPQLKSSVEYIKEAPTVSIIFNKDGELQVLDYSDSGLKISNEYKIAGAKNVTHDSMVEPIKILFKIEEEEKGFHNRIEVSASLPVRDLSELDNVTDLDELQNKNLEDFIFLSDLGVDINMSIYRAKESGSVSFISLEQFDLVGDNYAFGFDYNGGAVQPGASFPNGSGKLFFSNYQDFAKKFKKLYNLVEKSVDNSGHQFGTLFSLTGVNGDYINKYIDRVVVFLEEINDSPAVSDLNLDYALVPPFSIIVNNKNMEELVKIWTKIPNNYIPPQPSEDESGSDVER